MPIFVIAFSTSRPMSGSSVDITAGDESTSSDLETAAQHGLGHLDADVPATHDDRPPSLALARSPGRGRPSRRRASARRRHPGRPARRSAVGPGSRRSRSSPGRTRPAPSGRPRGRAPSTVPASRSSSTTSCRTRTSIPFLRCSAGCPGDQLVHRPDLAADPVRDAAGGVRGRGPTLERDHLEIVLAQPLRLARCRHPSGVPADHHQPLGHPSSLGGTTGQQPSRWVGFEARTASLRLVGSRLGPFAPLAPQPTTDSRPLVEVRAERASKPAHRGLSTAQDVCGFQTWGVVVASRIRPRRFKIGWLSGRGVHLEIADAALGRELAADRDQRAVRAAAAPVRVGRTSPEPGEVRTGMEPHPGAAHERAGRLVLGHVDLDVVRLRLSSPARARRQARTSPRPRRSRAARRSPGGRRVSRRSGPGCRRRHPLRGMPRERRWSRRRPTPRARLAGGRRGRVDQTGRPVRRGRSASTRCAVRARAKYATCSAISASIAASSSPAKSFQPMNAPVRPVGGAVCRMIRPEVLDHPGRERWCQVSPDLRVVRRQHLVRVQLVSSIDCGPAARVIMSRRVRPRHPISSGTARSPPRSRG